MDVINKFYSSVSSTVSQLSGVLPGNPVTREYEVTAHIASAGPGLLWKIYNAYKKSTKQEAAVFVFEKKQLETWNKADRDVVLESLKRGITQLTKLRHPQILTVQHPLEESRESLAFATEPVFASLANALGQTKNMPQPHELKDYKFFDVEIKYGLLQVGEGLAFLHNDVKLLHRNICPESIIINKQGAWKIFGFDFCIHNEAPPNSQANWPFSEYNAVMPAVTQPCVNYIAPEIILLLSHSSASDIFSLGMIAYTLHSPVHLTVIPCNDYQSLKQRSQQLPAQKLQCVPEGLRDYVKMMLSTSSEVRPDAHQFIKIPFFEDVGVKTLNYLDSLFQWDNMQKSQFYRGLPDALQKLPARVRLFRVLPCLVRDLIQPLMVPFVLPNVFNVAESCTKEEFTQHILPHLKPVMKLTEPIQILLIFLQRMELLLKLTPAEAIQQDVLPMLYRGLDADAQQIHELCLSVLPTFAGLLDHSSVKNSVLPRVKKLCLTTQSLSVRVNCLLCLGRLLEHLDKWLVLDEVLPFLPKIPSREPAVLMGILGIYKLALEHKKLGITKEVMATRILPFLMPLCIENGLTITQFNALVNLVKQMFQIVETEHRTKLQQLNSVHEERKNLEMNFGDNSSKLVQANTQLDMFSGLGLDNYLSKPPQQVLSEKEPAALSVPDKQRPAQQQDHVKILQAQPVIAPVSTVPPKIPPAPKDLPLQWPDPVQNIQWSVASGIQQNNFIPQSVNYSVQNPTHQNFSQYKPNPSLNLQPNNFVPSQNWSQAVANPWSSNKPPAISTNGNAHNWSALDSLLPSVANQKVPMNQMMHKQLLLQPAQQKEQKVTSSLSKDDIMDLLS